MSIFLTIFAKMFEANTISSFVVIRVPVLIIAASFAAQLVIFSKQIVPCIKKEIVWPMKIDVCDSVT